MNNSSSSTWMEVAKNKLHSLFEIAVKADLEAQQHLRSLSTTLVQTRSNREKQETHGGILGNAISVGIMLATMKKKKESILGCIGVNTANRWGLEANEGAKIEAKGLEILNSIPSMKIAELYQLIQDLMDKKPILDI